MRRITNFLTGLLTPTVIPRAGIGRILVASGLTDTGTAITTGRDVTITGATTVGAVIAGAVTATGTMSVTGAVTVNTGPLTLGTGNPAIVPAAVSGTPAQHGLYRENVIKGWVKAGVAANVIDSFNVSGLTDSGTGDLTVTWDRDFATGDYVIGSMLQSDLLIITTILNGTAPSVGSCRIRSLDNTGTGTDPVFYHVFAVGDQ